VTGPPGSPPAGQRAIAGEDASPGYIRRACRPSLRRLGTDRIDLYQLHLGELPADQAQEVAGTLDALLAEGLIRGYGWSTDGPQRAAAFAGGSSCTAIQHELNVPADAADMLAVCDAFDLASINRGPLAMGLLTGNFGLLDSWDTDRGTAWRARAGHYLTNPADEPDPAKWEVDVANLAAAT
jgi:aryl-alcohol dehydrogenase-like predicted oxidoreductase